MGDVALTIHLTREEYERLLQVAAREGRPVEELGADAVRHLLPSTEGGDDGGEAPARREGEALPDDDPLLRIARGLGSGGPPDLADRHDDYLERARRECNPSS
jgi:hypothetical protein